MPLRRTSNYAVLIVTILFGSVLTGCKSSSPAAGTTASGSVTSQSTVQSPALPTTFAIATNTDPSLNNMAAESFTTPSGWKFDGTMMIAPCTTIPWPVFRSYSADGLTEMRELPAMGWRWGPSAKYSNNSGCIALTQAMSAADFLNYYAGTIAGGVHIVGSMPIAAAFIQRAQNFANTVNNTPIAYQAARSVTTPDTAALRIETHNGSFVIEQRLRTWVECANNNNAGPLQGGNCWGIIDVLRAPQGKLDALVQLVDANNLPNPQPTPAYQQAVLARTQQQGQAAIATMNRIQQQAAATFQAMNQQFMQSMAQSNANFRAQQESQFQNFQSNMAAQQQVQSNIASDWTDYALDQQTVSAPGGGTAKVSNAASQTWTNGTQWFQTSDPSADPNNALSGTWTKATPVHGNGQPM